MRTRLSFVSMLLLLAAAAPAGAAPLVQATLRIDLGRLPAATFSASGATGWASGPLSATLGAGSAFAGTAHFTSPSSAAPPISGITFFVGSNAAGLFAGATPGNVGGIAPFDVRVCVEGFGLCLLDLDLPIGTPLTTTPPPVAGVGVTAIGGAWTAGVVSIPLVAPTSMGATAVQRTGLNLLHSDGEGLLVLVAPVNVLTSIAGQFPGFATLSLRYVPEPAPLPLAALALAAAAAARGWRARRSH
jgi:hypothetical protein